MGQTNVWSCACPGCEAHIMCSNCRKHGWRPMSLTEEGIQRFNEKVEQDILNRLGTVKETEGGEERKGDQDSQHLMRTLIEGLERCAADMKGLTGMNHDEIGVAR